MNKKFRIQYKPVALTYSYSSKDSCTFSYEKTRVLEFIEDLSYEVGDYMICKEKHKSDDPHIHVFLEFLNKPNIMNPDYFDIDGCHPNIKRVSNRSGWLKYIRKTDKQPLTNITTGYIQLAIDGETDRAIEQFRDRESRTYVVHKQKCEQNLRALGKRKRTPKPDFNIEDYSWPAPLPYDPSRQCLIMRGLSGIGKTSFAKAYCNYMGWSYMTINQNDDLRKYDNQDCIILDDVDFRHTPRNNQIKLCDIENDVSVHCRYQNAEIPWGVKRIFLCNPGYIPVDIEDAAIARRTYVWDVGMLRK